MEKKHAHLVLTTLVFLAVLFSTAASAQEAKWVLCFKCTTMTEFKNAAISKAPRLPGEYFFSVGNPNTEKMVNATVVVRREGYIIRSQPSEPEDRLDSLRTEQGTPIIIGDSAPLMLKDDDEQSRFEELNGARSSGYYSYRGSVSRVSEREQATFSILVRVSKNTVITNGEGYGFESFADANQAIVSKHAYTSVTTAFGPWWPIREVFQAGWKGLLKALEVANGHGIRSCVVFMNGDSACFKPLFDAPSASPYIKGSAKDKNGKPILD